MEKTALSFFPADSALVALHDMQIRPDLTNNAVKKWFGSNRGHAGRKNSFLAGLQSTV